MRWSHLALLGLFWLAAAVTSTAARAQDSVCDHQQSTKDMRDCASLEYGTADADLNSTYVALMKLLDTPQRPFLVKAEQAWIAYRDTQCAFAASVYLGGTAAGPIYMFCLVDITQARTKQLQDRLDYENLVSH